MRSLLVLACLLVGCADDGDDPQVPVVCTHEGHEYELGDTFPADDGCNTCSCTEMGITCTILGCAD